MWDPYAEFETAVLPNGLTVYATHWSGRPWEAMGFLIHSGAEHDPIGLEGLSHFVEHLVPQNGIVPEKELRTFFANCGGAVNLGRTDYPHTYYQFFVPADKAILSRAFTIFGFMLLSVRLESYIERERQVIISEFHRHYPTKFMFDLVRREHKAMYSGYWLERFVRPLGASDSIGRITQNNLQSHYNTHYTPANISVVGVGGMKPRELVELLSKSPFAFPKKGLRTLLPAPTTEVTLPSENRYVFEISKHISTTTPFEVGEYRSVAKIPGNVNAQSIRLLGNMLDEVLMNEVRDRRGWAYRIDSSWRNFRHFYRFLINCDGLALKALGEIENVVEACIASVGDHEDLFKQVKQQALASNSIIDPTGRGVCDGALDNLADHQRIISLTEYGNDIKRVTMNDIRNLLQWLRPEKRWTLIKRP